VGQRLLWGLIGGLLLTAGAVPAATLKAYRFENGEYVAVTEMAEFYRLGRDQSRDKEIAEFRSPAGQLTLQAERRVVTLNGVAHWLSAPVIAARDKLWISATDVLKCIDPVLGAERLRSPKVVRTIVLDPGHGGTDRGAQGRLGTEKVLTLDIARRVQAELRDKNLYVLLTRTTDRTVELDRRPEFAGDRRADLFVSIHLNSAGPSADGIETYCLTPAGAVSTASPFEGWGRGKGNDKDAGNRHDDQNCWLAHCIQKSLLTATGAADRGVRRARFVVIRDAPCPGVLVEGGFLSHAGEEKKLMDPAYRDKLAKAIAAGILQYKASVEKKIEPATPATRPR
jgi:N-acetylmuramoyl-L-alanine amidase